MVPDCEQEKEITRSICKVEKGGSGLEDARSNVK